MCDEQIKTYESYEQTFAKQNVIGNVLTQIAVT